MTNQTLTNGSSLHEPVLNQEILDRYRHRAGLVERLIEAYLSEAPQFYDQIRDGVQEKNLSDVKLNAHRLKSSSQNLGAVRLSELCQHLESQAAENNFDAVVQLSERLGPECFEVQEALKGERFLLKNEKNEADDSTNNNLYSV